MVGTRECYLAGRFLKMGMPSGLRGIKEELKVGPFYKIIVMVVLK